MLFNGSSLKEFQREPITLSSSNKNPNILRETCRKIESKREKFTTYSRDDSSDVGTDRRSSGSR